MENEIKSIEKAKSYFISMGCSHFHLNREDYERAKEYRSFNISSATESAWRQEEFDRRISNFDKIADGKPGLAFFSLAYLIETTDYYLQQLADKAIQILNTISGDQIRYFLPTVIGNDSTNTHGGLIQKSHEIKRPDLGNSFITCALTIIDKAELENVDITFHRGNLADIIYHYNLSELQAIALNLRQKDQIDRFIYYEAGAKEGNKFSMNMLSNHYREGKGCKIDLDKANYWEQKAKK